jgi:hypothetical protein
MSEQAFYGWFDDATQQAPTYEPPRDAPCPYCGKPITPDDVRTHSLMMATGYANRSYFYRTHRTCDETANADTSKAVTSGMDDFIFAMIERNGD